MDLIIGGGSEVVKEGEINRFRPNAFSSVYGVISSAIDASEQLGVDLVYRTNNGRDCVIHPTDKKDLLGTLIMHRQVLRDAGFTGQFPAEEANAYDLTHSGRFSEHSAEDFAKEFMARQPKGASNTDITDPISSVLEQKIKAGDIASIIEQIKSDPTLVNKTMDIGPASFGPYGPFDEMSHGRREGTLLHYAVANAPNTQAVFNALTVEGFDPTLKTRDVLTVDDKINMDGSTRVEYTPVPKNTPTIIEGSSAQEMLDVRLATEAKEARPILDKRLDIIQEIRREFRDYSKFGAPDVLADPTKPGGLANGYIAIDIFDKSMPQLMERELGIPASSFIYDANNKPRSENWLKLAELTAEAVVDKAILVPEKL